MHQVLVISARRGRSAALQDQERKVRAGGPRRLHPVLLILVGLAAGLLAACVNAPVAPPGPSAPSSVDGRAADVAYARAMIPHHEQALELAALVPGRSASADVADLAFRIDRDQVEEIGQLQGLLRLWGAAPDPAGGMGMTGMAEPGTLARLRDPRGAAFDRLWLQTMIAHHEGAVAMAREHLVTGADPGLRRFSETLVPTQQAEVARMRAVLAAPS